MGTMLFITVVSGDMYSKLNYRRHIDCPAFRKVDELFTAAEDDAIVCDATKPITTTVQIPDASGSKDRYHDVKVDVFQIRVKGRGRPTLVFGKPGKFMTAAEGNTQKGNM